MNQDVNIKKDAHRLSQTETIDNIFRDIPPTEMVTVHWSDSSPSHNHGFYCSLIPSSQIDDRLSRTSWDLSHGHGYPGICTHHKDGKDITIYYRYGDNSGIEPLIIDREFYGIRPDHMEISEEFRLFHRLYYDAKENNYIKIDEAGNENVIAIVEPSKIQIRLKEIRQFLAIKEMHLSIQFDCKEYSQYKLEVLKHTSGGANYKKEWCCWGLHYGDGDGICKYNSFSRLLGKHLIPPLPKEKSGMWFITEEKNQKSVDFIIDIDDDGEEIIHPSNPDELADYFGVNPEAPHYLTAVHFRKEVLDKYYQQSSKYSVEDSYLRCGSLWGMQMDNHHSDKVCAWLGDLGRDLPYSEQLHWRSHNIAATGGVSETYFKRQILSQFTSSERPEHNFAACYSDFQQKCQDELGWPLLLPLTLGDKHHLQSIRVPSTNEQKDFDDLIMALTKILVDSLNEKKLNVFIPKEEVRNIKGSISRLERVMEIHKVEGYSAHIEFLRKLQNLRSAGTAHRKGKNYLKIAKEFDIQSTSLISVFEEILVRSNKFIHFLQENICCCKVKC